MKKFILSLFCCMAALLHAEEEVAPRAVDVAKLSEALGHLLGKNLESMGMNFDMAKVVQGMQDSHEGKEAPMTEQECVQALATAQEVVFKEAASENLKKAEEFLAQNGSTEGITVLEEGKLQYLVNQEGAGAVVQENCSPVIQYVGKLLDGLCLAPRKKKRS